MSCHAFDSELSTRKKYNISSEYVEAILYEHRDSNYVNASLTTGNLLRSASERNEKTLTEHLGEEEETTKLDGFIKRYRISTCSPLWQDFSTWKDGKCIGCLLSK